MLVSFFELNSFVRIHVTATAAHKHDTFSSLVFLEYLRKLLKKVKVVINWTFVHFLLNRGFLKALLFDSLFQINNNFIKKILRMIAKYAVLSVI